MQAGISAALKELATAVAGDDAKRVLSLAGPLSQLPADQFPPGAAEELQHALGMVLAEAGAGDEAVAAHARALQEMARGAPDPRQVLREIDALIALAEARRDFAAAARLQAIAADLTRIIDGEDSSALRARLSSLSRLRMQTGEPVAAAAAAAEAGALELSTEGEIVSPPAAQTDAIVVPRPTLAPPRASAPSARSIQASPPLDVALESAGAPPPQAKMAPAPAPVAPSQEAGSDVVEVYFATSRTPTGSENPYRHYSGRRYGDVTPIHTYGVAEVSVPRKRSIGTLPTASWINRHAGYQNDELYLLKAIRELSDSEWRGGMTARLTQKPGREALIFVHGFNVEFWEAMVRAAQLAADLDIDGVVAAYSWPSRGNVLCYPTDRQEIIAPHIDELRKMISAIALTPGVGRVTVVAHSMGCEFLLPALKDLELELSGRKDIPRPLIKDVIFAAPDVDLAHFAGIVPKLSRLAGRVSVYCSEKDSALSWGRWLLMSHDRAGNQAGKLAAVLAAGKAEGVDTIDTTQASADMIGHSDFASSAIDDLRAIVWLSLVPQRRPTLVEYKNGNGPAYWVYRAANDGDVQPPFREALLLARRKGGVAAALAAVETELTLLKGQAGGQTESAQRWAQIGHALMAIA